MTWMIFHGDEPWFYSIWCLFGWVGTLVIPVNFWEKKFGQGWVELNLEGIILGRNGIFRSKVEKRVPFAKLTQIVIGADPKEEAEAEGSDTYVWRALRFCLTRKMLNTEPFYILTQWMSRDDEEMIFDRLRDHATKRSLPVTFVRHASSS